MYLKAAMKTWRDIATASQICGWMFISATFFLWFLERTISSKCSTRECGLPGCCIAWMSKLIFVSDEPTFQTILTSWIWSKENRFWILVMNLFRFQRNSRWKGEFKEHCHPGYALSGGDNHSKQRTGAWFRNGFVEHYTNQVSRGYHPRNLDMWSSQRLRRVPTFPVLPIRGGC